MVVEQRICVFSGFLFSLLHLVTATLQLGQLPLEDDIGGKFQKIEGSTCAFIERAMTVLTAENGVSQDSDAFQWGSAWGMAVGTVHGSYTGKGLQLSVRIPSSQQPAKV